MTLWSLLRPSLLKKKKTLSDLCKSKGMEVNFYPAATELSLGTLIESIESYLTKEEVLTAIKTWAKIGSKVIVRDDEEQLERIVVEHYDQSEYFGGVRIDPPVDNFYKSWNVADLKPAKEKK